MLIPLIQFETNCGVYQPLEVIVNFFLDYVNKNLKLL